jgi:hypothetical protein
VTVTGGVASTTFTVPGGQAVGGYTIAATYSDSTGKFGSSGGTGTLSVTSPSSGGGSNAGPSPSASNPLSLFGNLLTIAIDSAELTLVMHGVTSFGGAVLPPASFLATQMQENIAFVQTTFPTASGWAISAMNAGAQAANQALAQMGK